MRFMSKGTKGCRRCSFAGFTLIESLLVLMVSSMFLFFPVVAIEYYQQSAEVLGFCARLEKGLYTIQQSAIIDNTQTRAVYQAAPTPTVSFYGAATEPVTKIEVPPQLAMQAFPDILFSSQSGNNSSLRRIVFYWQEKKQTISYKFLFGSGRYEKIVE